MSTPTKSNWGASECLHCGTYWKTDWAAGRCCLKVLYRPDAWQCDLVGPPACRSGIHRSREDALACLERHTKGETDD